MKIILAAEERDRLSQTLLNDRQRDFISGHIRRGKQTAFARELARSKGVQVTDSMSDAEIERFVDDWVLLDFIDAGPDYAAKGYRCQCGRALRYVYDVQHRQTGERIRFGKEHFEEHTGIPAGTVKNILKGMEAIDYEQDELLLKLHGGWSFAKTFPKLPNELQLPPDVHQQLELGLPLLDRQILRLHASIRDITMQEPPRKPLEQKERQYARNEPVIASLEEGPLQFEFDFGSVSVPQPEAAFAVRSAKKPPAMPAKLEMSQLRTYIIEGINSARALCELLIARHGCDDRRFSSGKPEIYPEVCAMLDRLAASGEIMLVSAGTDRVDRVYRETPKPL